MCLLHLCVSLQSLWCFFRSASVVTGPLFKALPGGLEVFWLLSTIIKQYDLMHWIDSRVFSNQPLHVISDPNHILIIHHLSILTVCSGILVIFTPAKCCQVAFSLHFPRGQKYSEILLVVPHTLRISPKFNSPLFQLLLHPCPFLILTQSNL